MSRSSRILPRVLLLATALPMLAALGCYEPCESDRDCHIGLICIDDGESENGFCGLPDRIACRVTDGEWDTGSCGHYQCGQFPDCDAVIPGCNCGPGRVFEVGTGCVPSDDCPIECAFDEDCPEGQRCEGSSVCPPDVTCVWEGEPGVCVPDDQPPACDFDEDCGPGEYCDGSSVCPPDVVCVWEGEPGVCLPAESDEQWCRASGGRWDELSCGHYTCGDPPLCRAIIPGCDCGPDANFVEGEGCVKDRACIPGEDELCRDTGGKWIEYDPPPCVDPEPLSGEVICLPVEYPDFCQCPVGSWWVHGEGCVPQSEFCADDDACGPGEICEFPIVHCPYPYLSASETGSGSELATSQDLTIIHPCYYEGAPLGRCVPDPDGCWSHDDCYEGTSCIGVFPGCDHETIDGEPVICPQIYPPPERHPGSCELDRGRCYYDDDCAEAQWCDRDISNLRCVQKVGEPPCPHVVGECRPKPGQCFGNDECGEGTICRIDGRPYPLCDLMEDEWGDLAQICIDSLPGECVPERGPCYGDWDCAGDRVCDGPGPYCSPVPATFCPAVVPPPGECIEPPERPRPHFEKRIESPFQSFREKRNGRRESLGSFY